MEGFNMTAFNITKAVNKSLVNSIERYLNNGRVNILYTDWRNEFGVRFKTRNNNHGVKKIKFKVVNKVLWHELGNEPITKFTSCPRIDVQNAIRVAQYGRYNNKMEG